LLGIIAGMDENADANRFLAFSMLYPPEDRQKAWIEPTEDECRMLGRTLLAIAVVHAQEASRMAIDLHSRYKTDRNLDARQVSNLSVPVAMLATATGQDPHELFSRSIETIFDVSQEITRDDEKLVSRILELPVRAFGSEVYTVDFVAFGSSTKATELQPQLLQQLGIEKYDLDGMDYLAIYPPMISKLLDMEASSISQMLKSLPGTITHRHRSDIGRKRWVMVPEVVVLQEGDQS
jgi:hypothetical protein